MKSYLKKKYLKKKYFKKKYLKEKYLEKKWLLQLIEKIYKALKVHSEVLKKMGSHLSKLGKSKIRKPVHMEINEEEEKGRMG